MFISLIAIFAGALVLGVPIGFTIGITGLLGLYLMGQDKRVLNALL